MDDQSYQDSPVSVTTAAPPAPDPQVAAQLETLRKAVGSGGNWFYFIAGLSLVNTIIRLAGGSVSFICGLGITQLLDEIMVKFGSTATLVAVPLNVIIAGFYGAMGYLACRRHRWAFMVGMVLYALDALLFVLVNDWLSVGFHAFALWCISRGLKADTAARALEAQAAATPSLPVG